MIKRNRILIEKIISGQNVNEFKIIYYFACLNKLLKLYNLYILTSSRHSLELQTTPPIFIIILAMGRLLHPVIIKILPVTLPMHLIGAPGARRRPMLVHGLPFFPMSIFA